MAKYQLICNCSYGARGDVVEIKKTLSERQKVLMVPYEPPTGDEEGKKVEALEAENAELKAKVEALAELEKATKPATKTASK